MLSLVEILRLSCPRAPPMLTWPWVGRMSSPVMVGTAGSNPVFSPESRVLLVCVEGCVGEALALIFPEELAVAHANVVHLVARAAPIHALPLLWRFLSFPTRGAG